MNYQMHHNICVWMETAAKNLRESLKRDLHVEEKRNARDLVTEMDRQTEAFFVDKIQSTYPDHRIVGEEGTGQDIEDTKGIIWVIDPIDGTMNFVKQKNHFGIMIAIYQDGLPQAGYIYNVMAEDLYYGIMGEGAYLNHQPLIPQPITSLSDGLICGNVDMFMANRNKVQKVAEASLGARSYGAAALEIIGVIRGEIAAYVSSGLNPWDFGAGNIICQSMGFKMTDLQGQDVDILTKTPVVFAPAHIHEEIISILK